MIMQEFIPFCASWYETLKILPEVSRKPFLKAIFEYGFMGIEPDFSGDTGEMQLLRLLWTLVRPVLDESLDMDEDDLLR